MTIRKLKVRVHAVSIADHSGDSGDSVRPVPAAVSASLRKVPCAKAAKRTQSINNLKQIGLASLSYNDANTTFPSGNDKNNFSAAAYLLPYIEQNNVYQLIDFKKPMDDKANAPARAPIIKVFLSPRDGIMMVSKDFGATNYLFNAGSKPSLEDNDGIFYQDSKVKLTDITDGTSNTLLAIETLKGDGGVKAVDVRRQHVLLKKGDLKDIKDETGVKDWKDDKNIAADRCAKKLDGLAAASCREPSPAHAP